MRSPGCSGDRMKTERADALLVAMGLCDSREQAKRLILAGEVRIGDLTLLQPDDVRLVRGLERLDLMRSGTDTVDVEGDDLEHGDRSSRLANRPQG